MEKPNNRAQKKISCATNPYIEIFNFLKLGGHKITNALRKTHQAKPSGEIQSIRENLSLALDSINPVIPEFSHIRILADAIRHTMSQLDDTKPLFHSKGLMKIRNFGEELLREAKAKYYRTIGNNQPGGAPMK